ncbi:MAG: tetratricopeptide repeat protein, partial [Chloroflexota bacterium]|nr:tetratricopeptide repeat protein [Chloroflexota bacterium]
LYSDDFLAGFTLPDCPEFDEWQFFEREGFCQTLGTVLVQLIHVYQAQGEWEDAIEQARRWLALDTLHEPAHRQLMRLYALAGRQAAALRQYDECVRLLDEELGVPPEEETTELWEAIKTKRFPPAQAVSSPSSPLLPSLPYHPPQHNLPSDTTAFVGRENELAALVELLCEPARRLVTIVGIGGIGKTRLALAAARQMVEQHPTVFPDGIYLVPLAPLESVDLLMPTIAETFHLRLERGAAQLFDYLRDKQLLLVLDNLEHLLTQGDTTESHVMQLGDLLRHAPGVTLLVTSRERLQLHEEYTFPLGGLEVPDEGAGEVDQFAACQLFTLSAHRVQPDLAPSEAEWANIVHICRLVEGMPLALELAAGWVDVLPLETIAKEIEQRLDFLETELRNVPERHRSVRVVFDASWQHLPAEEQSQFACLSVFRGGFTRTAAEAVADISLRTLSRLANKSFLGYDRTLDRYRIHELLRHYAAEMLARSPDALDAVRDRHCTYYMDLLHDRALVMQGSEQKRAAEEIAVEFDNVRAAWQWAVEQGKLDVLQRANSLSVFCNYRSRFPEGAQAFEQAARRLERMPSTEAVDLVRARVLINWAWMLIRMGQLEQAEAVAEQSLHLYQQHSSPLVEDYGSDPRLALGELASIRGDYAAAIQLLEPARQTAEERNHRRNLGLAYYFLTGAAFGQGEYEMAQEYGQQAYHIHRLTGDRWMMAYCHNELGNVALALRDYDTAKQHFEVSYALRREFDDPEGMAVALTYLGEIALRQQETEQAEQLFQESLSIYGNINDKGGLARAHRGLGATACARGDIQRAGIHLHRALSLAAGIGFAPLIFSTLIAIAELWLKSEQPERAATLLTYTSQHPNNSRALREEAQQLLDGVRTQVEHVAPDRTLEHGEIFQLEPVITETLMRLEALNVAAPIGSTTSGNSTQY